MSKISELAKLYLPYVSDQNSFSLIKMLIQAVENGPTDDVYDCAIIHAFEVAQKVSQSKKIEIFINEAMPLLDNYNSPNATNLFLKLPRDIFTYMKSFVSDEVMAKLISNVSQTNRYSYGLFRGGFEDIYYSVLLQACIDDDCRKVERLLTSKSHILLEKLKDDKIIRSKFTGQKFHVEDPLMMAVKRKQIEMIKILLPHYQKLDKNTEINTALSAWTIYKVKANAQGQEEIVIPQGYAIYAKQLLDIFTQETIEKDQLSGFSPLAEEALADLYENLLPEKAIKLNEYLDVELFLFALYKTYEDHFGLFKDWAQRDAFCIRVIGLVQSVLSPEMAKIFCEGLYDVIVNKKSISKSAAALKLKDGEAYYRGSRMSHVGAGFTYLIVGGFRLQGWPPPSGVRSRDPSGPAQWFLKVMLNKCISFEVLRGNCINSQSNTQQVSRGHGV